jgi:glycosyltransferase involved in cell wall biosynthesis
MKRLKILAVAYACNPTRGSEFGVGWGWVNAIAERHDITVITADFNSIDIERHRSGHEPRTPMNPRFCYLTNRPWHYRPNGFWRRIEGSLAKPLMNLAYQDWLGYAFAEAEQEIRDHHYDLLHLITYVGWRFPGSFYKLDIPFVWGPIGGMKNTPWRLLPLLGLRGACYYGARNIINSLQLSLMQGPRRALRAAHNGIIAATSEIQKELWSRFTAESQVICEVGPPDLNRATPTMRAMEEPMRICWSGTHLPGKALHLLLRAAALLRDNDYRLEILGDGPCNRAWRALAAQLKISDCCRWHGWLSREKSLSVMRKSHVFAITSLKDLTSNVAVEAISLGLPVVCLDHCGFADLVTDNCGIKVPVESEGQIISDLANALRNLYENEAMRRRMANGALQRCKHYSWSSKMSSLDRVYSGAMQYREDACTVSRDLPTAM